LKPKKTTPPVTSLFSPERAPDRSGVKPQGGQKENQKGELPDWFLPEKLAVKPKQNRVSA
jgi:hypothetical protein